MDILESKLDVIFVNQLYNFEGKNFVSLKVLSGCNWDEWLKFCNVVGDFDIWKNQYIFVMGVFLLKNFDCFFILRCVFWKMVFDFDFMFEEKGFY